MISDYNPFELVPQIVTIPFVLLVLTIFMVVYYVKLKKIKVNEAPYGYVLLVQIYVEYVRNLVVEILGKRFEKITPYFIFLLTYLGLSNITGIIGLENPTASLTVTLTLGLVMFIGIFAIGFRYQKLSYLTRYTFNIKSKKTGKHYGIFINPLELVGMVSPLISISFRLWGNMFAGSMVIGLWFYVTGMLFSNIPYVGVLNLLGGLTAPPLHAYFDFLSGTIQALVFTMLTMIY
jgi:F-type H+-transporting ATPase subunit a